MIPRFFAPAADTPGALVILPDEEASHLRRVLRLAVGDPVGVFNGRGDEFHARVERTDRHQVAVRLGDPGRPAAEARVAVTLAQAVLKGDKMDGVVRDAVMIGVGAIQPLVTARAEVSLATLARSHRHERWVRIAVASTKQCGRAVVPAVHSPAALSPMCSQLVTTTDGPTIMLVEPGATASTETLGDLATTPPRAATMLVGPEGGWSPAELEIAATSGCRLVSLGARTLRADVMGLIALAALFARWQEFENRA